MHNREDVPKCSNGTEPITAVIRMVAPAIPPVVAFGTGTTLGATANLLNPEGLGQRLLAYIFSDGNGGSVMVPVQQAPMFQSPGLQRMDPILQSPSTKRKRRVSKYQREFGRQLKALKRKHPRTPVTKLMKRAHTATKKAMRRKK